jgi:hypothetical protein
MTDMVANTGLHGRSDAENPTNDAENVVREVEGHRGSVTTNSQVVTNQSFVGQTPAERIRPRSVIDGRNSFSSAFSLWDLSVSQSRRILLSRQNFPGNFPRMARMIGDNDQTAFGAS